MTIIDQKSRALLSVSRLGSKQQGSRFTLRKRAVRDDAVNLSSYNSDFLSGLFADVAKVNVLSELRIQQKRGSDLITTHEPDETDGGTLRSSNNNKRSRLSLKRCSIKTRASCKNLNVLVGPSSPKGINDIFQNAASAESSSTGTQTGSKSFQSLERHDSLAFQLNCVSRVGASSSLPASPEINTVVDVEEVFPHLPATVSDSSCSSGLTRVKLDRQVSNPETSYVDSFGWFVDLDGEPCPSSTSERQANLVASVSSDDLAFQAPTAPKRINDDAELEWAQAADTVDDVLGDFF